MRTNDRTEVGVVVGEREIRMRSKICLNGIEDETLKLHWKVREIEILKVTEGSPHKSVTTNVNGLKLPVRQMEVIKQYPVVLIHHI